MKNPTPKTISAYKPNFVLNANSSDSFISLFTQAPTIPI